MGRRQQCQFLPLSNTRTSPSDLLARLFFHDEAERWRWRGGGRRSSRAAMPSDNLVLAPGAALPSAPPSSTLPAHASGRQSVLPRDGSISERRALPWVALAWDVWIAFLILAANASHGPAWAATSCPRLFRSGRCCARAQSKGTPGKVLEAAGDTSAHRTSSRGSRCSGAATLAPRIATYRCRARAPQASRAGESWPLAGPCRATSLKDAVIAADKSYNSGRSADTLPVIISSKWY